MTAVHTEQAATPTTGLTDHQPINNRHTQTTGNPPTNDRPHVTTRHTHHDRQPATTGHLPTNNQPHVTTDHTSRPTHPHPRIRIRIRICRPYRISVWTAYQQSHSAHASYGALTEPRPWGPAPALAHGRNRNPTTRGYHGDHHGDQHSHHGDHHDNNMTIITTITTVITRRSPPRSPQHSGYQKPNFAAVSLRVSAERLSAASSLSDTGVARRELTPERLSRVGTDMHTPEMPWKSSR